MALGFMSFMQGVDITRAIGRVGLKVEPVLGPEIAQATASNSKGGGVKETSPLHHTAEFCPNTVRWGGRGQLTSRGVK